MKRLVLFSLFAGISLVSLIACADSTIAIASSTVIQADTLAPITVEVADPLAAINDIYATSNPDIKDLYVVDEVRLNQQYLIDPSQVQEFYITVTDINYDMRTGIANTFIIKPQPDKLEDIKNKLRDIQDVYIENTANFNVYNSADIAKNAIVFLQGEYVIMLMHEDNQKIINIIDRHIPKT
ncbi:MAG: DUF4358 domain-containing protein [Oscillospiraceae bacterium]